MIFIHSVSYSLLDERSTLDLISFFFKKKLLNLYLRGLVYETRHIITLEYFFLGSFLLAEGTLEVLAFFFCKSVEVLASQRSCYNACVHVINLLKNISQVLSWVFNLSNFSTQTEIRKSKKLKFY